MKTKTRICILVTTIAAAIMLWSASVLFLHEPIRYDVINLGNFGRDHIVPHAINDHGQIVGHFTPENGVLDGPSRAFVYDDFGGFIEIDRRCIEIRGLNINNRGQIVGVDAHSPALNKGSIFIRDSENGTIENIICETGKIVDYGNVKINNQGRIIGHIEKSNPSLFEAFTWDKEEGFKLLGTLGGKESVACSINDKGQVAGWSEIDKGYSHAFIFDDVNGMTDLGTLGGDSSRAIAINNKGQVLGYSSDSKGNFFIVIWDERGDVRRIKKIDSRSINSRITLSDNGQVIGAYSSSKKSWSIGKWFIRIRRQTKACPFIWSEQHGWIDLDNVFAADPKWQRIHLVDINNKGEILGYGRRFNSGYHIFILQPKNRKAKTDTKL